MDLDPATLSPSQRYKLLTCLIVPRPIALVTTLSDAGVINAAPFSFFNVMGADPPIVVLGIGDRVDGSPKDTALNIRNSREFVVNIVTEAIAGAMNVCGTDFPHGESELAAAGLTPEASHAVRSPRIAESPAHLECRQVQTIEIGANRVIIGEVVHLQIRDELIDRQKLYINTEALQVIGRMHAPSWYTRTRDLFKIHRK